MRRRRTREFELLGTFIRAHREHMNPSGVVSGSSATRRTPGLRREQVADLANIGLSWYTLLEQGRVSPSFEVLRSVGTALEIGPAGRSFMYELAGYSEDRFGAADRCSTSNHLRHVVDGWNSGPAAVLDCWYDIVLANKMFWDRWQSDASQANLAVLLASEHQPQSLAELRHHLPHFRRRTAAYRDVDRVAEIYAALDQTAPELSEWWNCQTMDGPAVFEPASDSSGGGGGGRQVLIPDVSGHIVLLQDDHVDRAILPRIAGK